jgi:hypothetical protein
MSWTRARISSMLPRQCTRPGSQTEVSDCTREKGSSTNSLSSSIMNYQ